MNTSPLVSVCVVTYNQQKYLKECLTSICNQITDFEFEIIVSDDCSTDRTRLVIEEFAQRYPEKLRVYIQDKNIGATKNYIYCHKKALGKYTAHCDGDDYWDINKLQSQVNFIESNSRVSAVLTNAYVVTTDSTIEGIFSEGVPEEVNFDFLVSDGNFLTHSSLLYKSTYVSEIFCDREVILDYDILINLTKLGNLGFIDRTLVYYRTATETSLLLNNQSLIKKLVWVSLTSLNRYEKINIIRLAKANFLAKEIIEGIRFYNIESLRHWLRECLNTIRKEGIQFIPLLIQRLVVNVYKKVLLNSFSYSHNRRKLKVYYKR